jgi:hypothetical protein
MLRRLKTALLMMFAAIAMAGSLDAQTITGKCAPTDTTSARLIAKFKSIVTSKTLASQVYRSQLGLENVTPSQIVLVTDKAICTRAAVALDAQLAQNKKFYTKRTNYTVYVLTLGTSYGVLANTIVDSRYTVADVYDRNWKYVSNTTF